MYKLRKNLSGGYLFITVLLILGSAFLSAYFDWLAIPLLLAVVAIVFSMIMIFDKPWFGVVLVAFFLPFERIGGFNVVGETTLRINQIFAALTIVSWIFYFLIIRKKAFFKTHIVWPILAYLGIAASSITLAVNINRAVTVFVFTLFVMIFALVIPQIIRKKWQVQRIVVVIILSCVLVSLFGLYQFAGDVVGLPSSLTGLREHYTQSVFGFPRIHSTALEPLYFANYLLIPISLVFLLFIFTGKKKSLFSFKNKLLNFIFSKKGLLLVLLLAVISLVLTLSRGGFLGLFVSFVFVIIFGWKKFFKSSNFLPILITGIVVVVVAVVFINLSGRFSLDTFLKQATEFQSGASIEERNSTTAQAWDLFVSSPVLGVGIGNFGPEVAGYSHRMPESGWLIVNNEPLEVLAETGVLGLSALVGLIILLASNFVAAWKILTKLPESEDKKLLQAVLGGLMAAFMGILVQYLTFSTLYILHIWFVIGFMSAVIILVRIKRYRNQI